jgi:hypothetical protein
MDGKLHCYNMQFWVAYFLNWWMHDVLMGGLTYVAVKMPFCFGLLQADSCQRTKQEDCSVFGLWRHAVADRGWSWQSIHVPRGKSNQLVLNTYVALHDCWWMKTGALLCLSKTFPQMGAAVRSVAKYFPTAIVSGRSRKKVWYARVLLY